MTYLVQRLISYMVLLRVKHIYIVIYICTKQDVWEAYQNIHVHLQ